MQPDLPRLLADDESAAFDWSAMSPTERGAWLRSLARQSFVFHTSGTTGPPLAWERTGDQLIAEAELALREVIEISGVDRVITCVSPKSLYGTIFGCVIPALQGLPVVAARLQLGDHLQQGCPFVVAIPHTWRELERARQQDGLPRRMVLVHSTATIPSLYSAALAGLRRGAVLTEAHGSTECGLIGHREATIELTAPWTVVSDATVRRPAGTESEHRLIVAGPRIGVTVDDSGASSAARSFVTTDVGRVLDEQHYVFAGRRDRVAKPGGVLVRLDDVEQLLRSSLDLLDVGAYAVQHLVRGDHWELAINDPASTIDDASVRLVLHRAGIPTPCRISRVDVVKRSPAGKTLIPIP